MNHRADLNYLLDNMGAEIAIGHSYVRGGDMPDVPPSPGGLLGADFAIENGRYKITRIYDNESWNPDLRAPLAAPGVDVNVGDYILAINGVELNAPDNIYRLLDGTANRQTRAHRQQHAGDGRRAAGDGRAGRERAGAAHARVGRGQPPPRRQAVERPARVRLCAEHRPAAATRASTATTSRSRTRRARSIDERYNGGGSAADYIIDVLGSATSTATSTTSPAIACRSPVPSAGIWGPKVMIINEMAGSGGDLMPYMFKRRKIGPLVGKRTWGGLVHTADTPPFIDGGSMIAPRGGFFTRDGKWAVENEGVGARHRRRELAEGRDRRPRSAARARRRGSDAAAEGAAR